MTKIITYNFIGEAITEIGYVGSQYIGRNGKLEKVAIRVIRPASYEEYLKDIKLYGLIPEPDSPNKEYYEVEILD